MSRAKQICSGCCGLGEKLLLKLEFFLSMNFRDYASFMSHTLLTPLAVRNKGHTGGDVDWKCPLAALFECGSVVWAVTGGIELGVHPGASAGSYGGSCVLWRAQSG